MSVTAAHMREPFTFDKKIVARDGVVLAGKTYRVGEEFEWRRLGISEWDVFRLWAAMQVDCAPRHAPPEVKFKGATGERVHVPPPSKRHEKHQHRP